MAVDIFLKLGDIKGESTDDKHKNEIEVLSFSGASPTLSRQSSPGHLSPAQGEPSGLLDREARG